MMTITIYSYNALLIIYLFYSYVCYRTENT